MPHHLASSAEYKVPISVTYPMYPAFFFPRAIGVLAPTNSSHRMQYSGFFLLLAPAQHSWVYLLQNILVSPHKTTTLGPNTSGKRCQISQTPSGGQPQIDRLHYPHMPPPPRTYSAAANARPQVRELVMAHTSNWVFQRVLVIPLEQLLVQQAAIPVHIIP